MHALEKQALDDPFLAEALEGASSLSAADFKKDVLAINASIGERTRKKGGTTFTWNRPLRIAAGLLLLAASSYLVIRLTNGSQNNHEQLALNNDSEKIAEPENAPPSEQAISPSDSVVKNDLFEIIEEKANAEISPATPSAQPPLAGSNEPAPQAKPSIASATPGLEFKVEQDEVAREENEVVELTEKIETKEKLAQAMPKEEEIKQMNSDSGYISFHYSDSKKSSSDNIRITGAPAAKGEDKTLDNALAQGSKMIKGKVIDAEDGTPLPGVNVVVSGTTQGTVTDIHGEYEIAVADPGGSLAFSFVGLENQEVTVGDREEIDVQMSPDVSQLSEIVVVGYGTEEEQPEGTMWELAEPEGGRKEYKKYLEKSLIYPQQAIENNVEGKVTVQFTIEPTGQLTDFRVTKSLGHGCDDEVVRLIKQGPRWSPTKRNTEPVRGKVKVKMKFQLPKEKKGK